MDLYSSMSLHSKIFLSAYGKMIATNQWFTCIKVMSRLYPADEFFAFFTNGGFAFSIPKVRRIRGIYASDIICKKFVLDFKPLFLLCKLVESGCYFLRCHCHCLSRCHCFIFLRMYNY